MANKNLEFITQFTASAGGRINIVNDIEKYQELIFEIYRPQASTLGNYAAYILIEGATAFDNYADGYSYSPQAMRAIFHYEFKGVVSCIKRTASSGTNYSLQADTTIYYTGTPNGKLYVEAGLSCYDGTEIVTVYGSLK